MRHELEHINNATDLKAANNVWLEGVMAGIKSWKGSANPGPQPLTAEVAKRVQNNLDDEAKASLRGWNSAVDAAMAVGPLDLRNPNSFLLLGPP